jgi:hypothetical protein
VGLPSSRYLFMLYKYYKIKKKSETLLVPSILSKGYSTLIITMLHGEKVNTYEIKWKIEFPSRETVKDMESLELKDALCEIKPQ